MRESVVERRDSGRVVRDRNDFSQIEGFYDGFKVAKLLVEAQGGRINFESVPGRQTRFWIDLPLAA